jgi:uncharacterized protein YutE (UPF0331/DUF86 family)
MIKKEEHCMRDCVLFKEWLQKKFWDIDPRKEIDH